MLTLKSEIVTCSTGDKISALSVLHNFGAFLAKAIVAISLLAQEVCNPLYSNTTALGASVTSAIASATAFAASAVASKDATDIKSYPPCAVSLYQDLFSLLLDRTQQ